MLSRCPSFGAWRRSFLTCDSGLPDSDLSSSRRSDGLPEEWRGLRDSGRRESRPSRLSECLSVRESCRLCPDLTSAAGATSGFLACSEGANKEAIHAFALPNKALTPAKAESV